MNAATRRKLIRDLNLLYQTPKADIESAADKLISQYFTPSNVTPITDKPIKNQTKAIAHKEFKKTHGGKVYDLVLDTLKEVGPMSRADIANETGLKMSTVCARIAEMLEDNVVYVTGTKVDASTDRTVEELAVV